MATYMFTHKQIRTCICHVWSHIDIRMAIYDHHGHICESCMNEDYFGSQWIYTKGHYGHGFIQKENMDILFSFLC